MFGRQEKRLIKHWAAFNGIEWFACFQAAIKFFNKRAFSGANRAHEIEHLARLLASQKSRIQIANYLRKRFFNAEKVVREEIVHIDRLIFIKTLCLVIFGFLNIFRAGADNLVIGSGIFNASDPELALDGFLKLTM